VAGLYGIAILPTVMIFRHGKVAGRCVGANESKMRDLISQHVRF
jgi:hypothetical protein